MGWQIYRIWSTDWFNNPDIELRKVVEEIEKAKSKTLDKRIDKSDKECKLKVQPKLERTKEKKYNRELEINYYQVADFHIEYSGFEFHEISDNDFERLLNKIIDIEGPIHKDILFKRITELAGVNRVGKRIYDVLNNALRNMSKVDIVAMDGDFVWHKNNNLLRARNREHFPARYKKIQYIHPKEIESAITESIRGTYGIRIDLIPPIAAKLLGFSSTSEEIRNSITLVVRMMMDNNILTDKDVIL